MKIDEAKKGEWGGAFKKFRKTPSQGGIDSASWGLSHCPWFEWMTGICLKTSCSQGKFRGSTCTHSILVASFPIHTNALQPLRTLLSCFCSLTQMGEISPKRSSQVLRAVRLAWWWVRCLGGKSALNFFSPLNQFISSLSQDADSFMLARKKNWRYQVSALLNVISHFP